MPEPKSSVFRDAWQGTSVRFDYPIARLDERMKRGETLYVVLHKDKDSTWSVVSTGSEMPSELTADAVVIRGRVAVARDPIYVLLNRESREKWKADSLVVGGERPFGKLKRGQAVARAAGRRDYVDFGMESYYIPDRERNRVYEF